MASESLLDVCKCPHCGISKGHLPFLCYVSLDRKTATWPEKQSPKPEGLTIKTSSALILNYTTANLK